MLAEPEALTGGIVVQEEKKVTAEPAFKASTWFSDYEAMKKVVRLYHNIHPFIYSLNGGRNNDGELVSLWSKKQRSERVAELRKLNPNILIIPTIFRWENKNELIQEAIGMNGRNDIRDHHIKVILNEIETYNYDGIDIDYEGMTCDKKEKFEEFIVLLSAELKKRNKILSVAVHPKTPIKGKAKFKWCAGLKEKIKIDYRELWRGPMTHDYEFLARYADKIKVMAYELHPRKYHNPGPGPQAPSYWLENIIEYAKDRVPPEKLYMAIPTYGYDWALNCNSAIKAVYWSDVLRIMNAGGINRQPTDIAAILRDTPGSSAWTNLTKFAYVHSGKIYEDGSLWYNAGGCQRLAFYMNRKAFETKMNLLRRHDLAGFSFWQLLSDNDPGINQYLELLIEGKLPAVIKAPKKRPFEIAASAPIGDKDLLNFSQTQNQKQGVDVAALPKPSTQKNNKWQKNSTDYSGVSVIDND